MTTLFRPVGKTKKAVNQSADVNKVKKLLNGIPDNLGGPKIKLILNGAADAKFFSAIEEFQKLGLPAALVNGLVEPGSQRQAARRPPFLLYFRRVDLMPKLS